MGFIKSLFMGSPGAYDVGGVKVNFEESPRADGDKPKLLKNRFLDSRLFRLVSGDALHTFVHEMGHAIAYKLIIPGCTPVVTINETGGATQAKNRTGWRNTVINLAGPLANMVFSGGKLAVAAAIRQGYLGTPLAIVLGGGALCHMALELGYACASARDGDGDFGDIANEGPKHLALASTALIGQTALNLLAANFIYFR
jgi:hypothetical protein